MMWDNVIEVIRTTILDDGILAAIYGDRVRMATPSGTPFDPKVPILEYLLVGDTENELWAPTIIQFDQWAPTIDDVVASERRLRRLFHVTLPRKFGPVYMWGEYAGGEVLATPDRNGFDGRAIRFRFTPLRERYAGLASGS
jgi:hypothetical protein